MSNVTNVLLHIWSDNEPERMQQINEYIERADNFLGRPLMSVEDPSLPKGWYGGTKYLECSLYVGAYNYLSLSEFIEHLQSIQWTEGEVLQLIVMEQEEMEFKIINIKSWKD